MSYLCSVSLVSRGSGCPTCVVIPATVTIVGSVLTVPGSNLFGFLPVLMFLKLFQLCTVMYLIEDIYGGCHLTNGMQLK